MEGKVSVKWIVDSFEKRDTYVRRILNNYCKDDVAEMPYTTTEYLEEAALWATNICIKLFN